MRGDLTMLTGGLALGIGAALLAILFCGRVPSQKPVGADESGAASSDPEQPQALAPRSSRADAGRAPGFAPGSTGGAERPPRTQPARISEESADERGERRLDEALLAESGMDDDDIAWLSEHFEAAERDRMRLRAAAEAEDRPLSREERELFWQLETQLEREIGSENYDRLLYAAGDYNRVRVRMAAPGSPAEAAGLEAGDFIVRYDGIAIFRYGHLRDLLFDTESETSLPIEVMRGGELFELSFSPGSAPKPPRGVIFGLSVTQDREAP